jgi:transcriptional regulator with XRE-family HTH domain
MYNKLNRKEKKMKNVLKETREKQHMSQEELANKSKVSRTIISELENNKTDVITNVTLEKLSKALGKKVTDIFFKD